MSPKIPSSLKWLIDKRARLEAEIQKTESSLAKAKVLIEELSTLKDSLAAIDQTLSIHEINVDVCLISPIRSHYVRINLPHGELTRSILLCLRLHQENAPIRTSEIVAFLEARHADLAAKPEKRPILNRSVQNRLNSLAREGVIQRYHLSKTGGEGSWSLVSDSGDE